MYNQKNVYAIIFIFTTNNDILVGCLHLMSELIQIWEILKAKSNLFIQV